MSFHVPEALPSPRLVTVQVTVNGASTEAGALVAIDVTCRSGSAGIGVPMMSMGRAL
jgi:hypothetical protein